MDEIQKILVKEGRKDLAQKYYEKVSKIKNAIKLSEPIIPDAIKLISKSQDATKFTNRSKFDKFLDNQKYFSASESHCFYNKKDLEDFHKGKKDSEKKCYILKDTGDLVAVWDDKNNVGYIIQSKH